MTPDDPPPITRLQTNALGVLLLVESVLAAALLAAIFPTMKPTAAAAAVPQGLAGEVARDATVVTLGTELDFSPGWAWLASDTWWTVDRGLLTLAMLAGILGSSIHTLQSFAAFVGDRKLERSWVWWYVLRAPIGAILGLFFYVALRGGVLTIGSDNSSASINPYGVVAICGLAGWFSKRATDKLAEVFDILFRTAKETEFTGKLGPEADKPVIDHLEPASLAAAQGGEFVVIGKGFADDAQVQLEGKPLEAVRDDAGNLKATVPPGFLAVGRWAVIVVNPTRPVVTQSEPFELTLT